MLFKESEFKNAQGITVKVYYKSSVSESQKAILLFHGYAEYVDRYRSFMDRLSREGYHVYAIDHAGHGRSGGKRALVKRFSNLTEDASQLFGMLRTQHPSMQWYVFGHSMGGGVALDFTLRHQDELKGMMLSGPLIALPDNVPGIVRVIGRILSKITPSLPIVPIEFEALSRDPDVVKRYREDPMVYPGAVRARTAIELDNFTGYIQKRLSEIRLPFWVGHGSLDRVTLPTGSRMLADQAASKDKTHKIYHGLFHEILNEPEGEVVTHDIVQWLKKH